MAIARQQIKPMETALADTPRDCDAGPSISLPLGNAGWISHKSSVY
jgi:hypothetical protein